MQDAEFNTEGEQTNKESFGFKNVLRNTWIKNLAMQIMDLIMTEPVNVYDLRQYKLFQIFPLHFLLFKSTPSSVCVSVCLLVNN